MNSPKEEVWKVIQRSDVALTVYKIHIVLRSQCCNIPLDKVFIAVSELLVIDEKIEAISMEGGENVYFQKK